MSKDSQGGRVEVELSRRQRRKIIVTQRSTAFSTLKRSVLELGKVAIDGWDEAGEKLILVSDKIWKPSYALDLENTIEQDLRDLSDRCDEVEVVADPYQMHRSMTTLQAAGLPTREFAQTQAICTLMGQTILDLLTGQNLVLYARNELRQQALSTVAVGIRAAGASSKRKHRKRLTPLSPGHGQCCGDDSPG